MTSTEIDIRQQATLAIRPGQEFWTDKQRAALTVLGIRGASNADLAVFMHYCQKTGLDPFSRQIYGIMRREKINNEWVDKFTIQVGIDGFRVIRDRIAARLGITVEYEDTIWYDADGRETSVWLTDDPPAACKVTVLRNGKRFPAVVRTASYIAMKDGRPVSQWRTQPDHMIEKCAEAFALRRAFPHDLGGLYIEEEMPEAPVMVQARAERVTAAEITGQRTPEPAPAVKDAPEATPKPPSKASLDRLQDLLRQVPLGDDADHAVFRAWVTGHPADGELTNSDVLALTKFLTDAFKNAGGDGTEAASRIWAQYKKATGQQDQAGSEVGDG